ncbi:DUF397 domain-containing protein [Streptomyces fulvoviolaceus]|uniref:DUF397 domain-containing protein n=1 Tax=Streptomyces fulvoviolaceus TaxID=285535 RepID=UPI000ABB1C7C|nr:DUF397 domain-containing protein [Streptomyces fulvoviolaceus]MCT9079454.1 DUF397 domain-containing protein [Streptomyces fulvoviolaceus]
MPRPAHPTNSLFLWDGDQLVWQKSSFSTGGEGECVELATADTPNHIHLRESDQPYEIATTTSRALANLLHAVKAGSLSR